MCGWQATNAVMGHSPALQEALSHSAGTSRTCSKCGQVVAGTLNRCPHDAALLLSAEAMARVGARVGDYEIQSVICEGGTGVFYRGRHIASDRAVALELLRDHCAQARDLVEKFIGEARATSRIRHPNVVDLTDVGTTPDGTVFLATEYLDGESLRSRLSQVQRLPLFEAINIMRQVARGLGAAHEAGIVHGGLEPANIFLCRREGRRRIVRRSKAKGMRLAVEPEVSFDLVKLLDFGVARFLDLSLGAQANGGLCGTAHYLSPEQAQMQPADQRSDIYALGAVFYEMITGTVPFGGKTLADILKEHVSGAVIAPSRRTPQAGIDARIDALIMRCLKKSPPLRFATTRELCEALDACITDCAFLRDAHRLPGIVESGIDLTEALPEARRDPTRLPEKPAAAPAAAKPAVAPISQKPVGATPVPAPLVARPAAAPVVAKPAVLPVAEKPAAAPVFANPAAAPVRAKPVAVPVVAKTTAAPVAEKPAPPPAAPKLAGVPMPDDPAAAMATPRPVMAAIANDPAAAVKTPPPTPNAMANDQAAVVLTPPPAPAADMAADPTAEVSDQPSLRLLKRPDAIMSDLEDRPERFDLEAGSRRPQVIALAGVLLLAGAGIAVWATRSGSAQITTNPARTAPAPTTPPSPPPLAAAPVAAPAAPAAPAAAAPEVALPRPEPATPAKMARPTARGPVKLAASRPHPARAGSASRTAPVSPGAPESAPAPTAVSESAPAPAAVSETAPAPAAKPEPRADSEPPAPSAVTAEKEPMPPAPATADDLVREAQRAWMRGHYAVAIGKAQAALMADPKPAQAVQAQELIGTCSCAIGDADAAREAASHLNDTKRELVKAACAKRGVTIE